MHSPHLQFYLEFIVRAANDVSFPYPVADSASQLNNNLGVIANSHLATADALGPLSADAIRFAEGHNVAVDFFKTGIPVSRRHLPQVKRWPDFMGKVLHRSETSIRTANMCVDRSKCGRVQKPERAGAHVSGDRPRSHFRAHHLRAGQHLALSRHRRARGIYQESDRDERRLRPRPAHAYPEV
jgi:hypothetical protein